VKAIPPKREGDFENREGILSKEQKHFTTFASQRKKKTIKTSYKWKRTSKEQP
jgi:hypothetical protein